ncbi:hypothetical protein [Pseudoalteromonas sp. R3]|uniref:hypothetical protein n=1 Tax=Pseudoalteromonas sp. R3 TaxID=1709477 RepID=UPI0006B5ED2E|nr:hypothetical protein [Pseudoalteromonas sp. R3]AZZ98409.1 hypothetical protein ELR70_15580 [Pseudoalteromonas sp. R3]
MKKTTLIVIFLTLYSSLSLAGDIPCHGNIVFLMADHSGCTDANGKRQLAFKTNSGSNPWMCARTDLGSSMLLAAKAANRKIQVYVSDQNKNYTCNTIPNYSTISYIIMHE